MQDITNFLSKSTIKPELMHVYVQKGYAVATDSFRLVEIKLDDFCTEHIKDGYYSAIKWKTMYKAYTKKTKDIITFMRTIEENGLYQDSTKHFHYPEYQNVVPKPDTLKPFDPSMSFNFDYLVDFMELTRSVDGIVDFSKIKTDGKMMYFENDTMKVLLMNLNK